MKPGARWVSGILAVVAMVAMAMPGAAIAQQKKLVLWTHWDQNPEFNRWYETKGKEFAKKSGYDVEVITIPYQGYDKHLALIWHGAAIGDAKLWYDQARNTFSLLVALEISMPEPSAEQLSEVVGVDVGMR